MSYLIHLSQSAFNEIQSKLAQLGAGEIVETPQGPAIRIEGVTVFPPTAPKPLVAIEGYTAQESLIIRIIADQFAVEESTLHRETNILHLGADSLEHIELVMAIEDELGIEVPDGALSRLGDISRFNAFLKCLHGRQSEYK